LFFSIGYFYFYLSHPEQKKYLLLAIDNFLINLEGGQSDHLPFLSNTLSITFYLEQNQLIIQEQSGFRKNRRTANSKLTKNKKCDVNI
ncbi:hypothetical protein BpHYR1_039258, partial [Brachionus plicatilis]